MSFRVSISECDGCGFQFALGEGETDAEHTFTKPNGRTVVLCLACEAHEQLSALSEEGRALMARCSE